MDSTTTFMVIEDGHCVGILRCPKAAVDPAVRFPEVMMAIWRVTNFREGFRITYWNRGTGETFVCGTVRHDTPESMLVDWICHQDATVAWDWLVLPGGRVFQVLPPCRSRV